MIPLLYATYLLVHYLLARALPPVGPTAGRRGTEGGTDRAAAFVAGLVYAFASNKMSYAALGQWNIASSQWIPFYVLYLFQHSFTFLNMGYSSALTIILFLFIYQ